MYKMYGGEMRVMDKGAAWTRRAVGWHRLHHDDVFGGLDNRKKENLRDVMRSCANKGIQQIVTVIDGELPSSDFFDNEEIMFRLHDDGDDGRLFKTPEW